MLPIKFFIWILTAAFAVLGVFLLVHVASIVVREGAADPFMLLMIVLLMSATLGAVANAQWILRSQGMGDRWGLLMGAKPTDPLAARAWTWGRLSIGIFIVGVLSIFALFVFAPRT